MENKWELLESSDEDREKIWKKNRTFAGDVWFRFRHKPTAVGGLILILVLLLLLSAILILVHVKNLLANDVGLFSAGVV